MFTDNAVELELDEEGTRISLTIVDTPGFGDQIDNEARYGRRTVLKEHTAANELVASARLLATSNASTMIFLRRSPVLSVIPASATTVSTLFSTSSPLLGTGM